MIFNNKKLLLIEPPFYRLYKDTYSLDRFPLSLAYLAAAVLDKTDWKVMAYNADFVPESELIRERYLAGQGFQQYLRNLKDLSGKIWDEVRETIASYEPSVVGISAKSQNFASACAVAKFCKQVNDKIVVIAGGPHPSMAPQDMLSFEDVDIYVKGEGEQTIVDLLQAIDTGGGLDAINGIRYKTGDEIITTAPRALIDDLDALSFPHETAPRVLKDYGKYPLEAFRYVFAVRGCPNNCFFCGSREIWSRRVRIRSVKNVIEEIKGLQKTGLEYLHFDDDIFGVKKSHIKELCSELAANCPGLRWSCEIHVKLVTDEIIDCMKQAGCHFIQIGVESGNNEILKRIRKSFTIDQALAAAKTIRRHGVHLQAFFMVGFPWETEQTLAETVQAIKSLTGTSIGYSIFTPYPGTEAFQLCKEQGLIGNKFDISLHNHQSPVNSFCLHIPPERFRMLASQIEKMVDRKNLVTRITDRISLRTIKRIRELGFKKSFQKGMKLLEGK